MWSPGEIVAHIESRWGVQPHPAGPEWHMPCPFCGGRDRFIVFPDGGYWCRPGPGHCGRMGFLFEDVAHQPTPEERREWARIHQVRQERREREIAQRLARLQTDAERGAYLLGRTDADRFRAREYFTHEGISERAIARYGLGFIPDHWVKVGDEIKTLAAYTIPIREPGSGRLVNIQYRLAQPPPGVEKYRQVYGLPAASFYADDRQSGEALVVEGAKKAIVVSEFTGMQVIGLPGNTPRAALFDPLRRFERIYLLLDPGSETQVERIVSTLQPLVIGVVNLPGKPDDLIVQYGLTHEQWDAFLAHARWGNT